jgi:release factor glutamine methyltransferase
MNEPQRKPARWTIEDVLLWTTRHFSKKGIASPRLDAEVLLAHALNVDRLHLYLNLDAPLLPEERDRYRVLVERRARREPVALIIGQKEFWSIPLRIPSGVLIPRPETELLVEAVLAEIGGLDAPTILEIGTGSGAVSIALARENPRARIVATDIDLLALRAAADNARDAGVDSSITFVASDLFSAFRPDTRFDVICSNPPYIPHDVIPSLEPEISRFEPRRALDGGADGLEIVRRILRDAGDFLCQTGALVLEIGDGQAPAVREIFLSVGKFREIRILPDLAGRPRVAKGKR